MSEKTERYAATAGITTQAVLRAIARLPGLYKLRGLHDRLLPAVEPGKE